MITDLTLETFTQEEILRGKALAWVIDGDVLYDLPLKIEYANIFLYHDEVQDVSSEYSYLNGITVRFKKDGQILEDLNTSEYFGSILLSNPLVLDLNKYKNGSDVMSPYAKFNGEEFVILN